MAQFSVWRVRFSLVNSAGKVVAGPYMTNVGISGGTPADHHTPSVASALVTAITNNLSSILGPGNGGSPSGSVQVDSFDHACAAAPGVWT